HQPRRDPDSRSRGQIRGSSRPSNHPALTQSGQGVLKRGLAPIVLEPVPFFYSETDSRSPNSRCPSFGLNFLQRRSITLSLAISLLLNFSPEFYPCPSTTHHTRFTPKLAGTTEVGYKVYHLSNVRPERREPEWGAKRGSHD